MIFLRVLGKTLLFLAFGALIYDGARSLATPGQGLLFTPIAAHLHSLAPSAGGRLEQFFTDSNAAFVWPVIVSPLLAVPLSLALAALGAILFMAGYRKPPPTIVGD